RRARARPAFPQGQELPGPDAGATKLRPVVYSPGEGAGPLRCQVRGESRPASPGRTRTARGLMATVAKAVEVGGVLLHLGAPDAPLVSAMLTGGVCVLDEGNRMNEKSWASLAPLLDHRRYVESVVAGITIPAHPDFRVCVTMNEDESTYEVPDYILSRLQPTLTLGFPSREDEMAILRYHLPFAREELLALTVDFLQRAHELELDFSPRDGINLLRYAIKR